METIYVIARNRTQGLNFVRDRKDLLSRAGIKPGRYEVVCHSDQLRGLSLKENQVVFTPGFGSGENAPEILAYLRYAFIAGEHVKR